MTSGVDPGSRLGPYELVSRIGAGGMGEVWKAKDTRLDRSVAIKVLPGELASDAQFRVRFEREARTISQLNHPHICVVHDVGEVAKSGDPDGTPVHYLVMELLEGESLAARLSRGPLPLEQVLRIGAQIAEALDAAHRHGIVHRDLKPANVMLTKSGAKLLDFGLARTAHVARLGGEHAATIARGGASDSPDGARPDPLTAEGTIVGTFQYMAPEQLEGSATDARTDIFALGDVLYEMATGHRAFDGKTRTSIIAAIVDRDPPSMQQFQPLTPPAFEHLVARCLAKNPDDRWQSAHDIAEELSWIREAGSQAGVAAPVVARKRSRERLAWVLAAAFAVSLGVVSAVLIPKVRRASQPFVADIAAPRGARFNATGDFGGPLVLSPDGTLAVFSVTDGSGNHLMLRSLITGETKVLGGTEGARFPFWSPDSRQIGFFMAAQLERVDVTGGAPVPICHVATARGGSWGAGDVIVFASDAQSPISRVAAGGGAPVDVTKVDPSQHSSHRWPSFLPDGKRFLYLACNHLDPSGSVNAIYVGSVDGAAPRMILRSASNAVYADGYLLFNRGQTLYAQKLKDDLSPDGEPVAIAQDAMYDPGIWRGAFSVSRDGRLSYHSGPPAVLSKLLWMDRHGTVIGTAGDPNSYWDFSFSPDRKKVLLSMGDPQRDFWVQDLERNSRTKITISGLANLSVWSPDSAGIYVDVWRSGESVLLAKRIAGGERVLGRGPGIFSPRAVSPDGKTLILETDGLIERFPLDQPGKPVPIVRSEVPLPAPSISPNGKWLAYAANETGRSEVFVISLARPELKWQVSSNGGQWPRWRSGGKEMYFVDMANHVMATPVLERGDDLTFGSPEALFEAQFRTAALPYDVTADGQKFLVNVMEDHEPPTVVILNDWKTRLVR